MTLETFFNYYLTNYATLHTRSADDFKKDYRLYLTTWGSREMESIKKSDIIVLQAELTSLCGPGSASKALVLLSILYNKAIEWEMFEGKNPAARIRKFKYRSRERFLSCEELPRFLAAVDSLRSPTTRDFFYMLLFTAQRRRNVAEMTWTELDFSRRVWTIGRTKNGTSHACPLIDEALAILARRFAEPDRHPVYVFARNDGSGPIWARHVAWKRVCEKAELEDLRIHDLRRTLASWQAITGSSLLVIGRTLNHKSMAATAIYAKLNLDPVRESMERAAAAMLNTQPQEIAK